jgi:hypothetical protein
VYEDQFCIPSNRIMLFAQVEKHQWDPVCAGAIERVRVDYKSLVKEDTEFMHAVSAAMQRVRVLAHAFYPIHCNRTLHSTEGACARPCTHWLHSAARGQHQVLGRGGGRTKSSVDGHNAAAGTVCCALCVCAVCAVCAVYVCCMCMLCVYAVCVCCMCAVCVLYVCCMWYITQLLVQCVGSRWG